MVSFVLPFIILFRSQKVVPSVTVNVVVYATSPIVAVTLPVPGLVGVNVTFSSRPVTFLSSLPFEFIVKSTLANEV